MGSCVSSQENPKGGVFLQSLSQSGVEPCPVLSGDSSSCFINPVVPSSVVDAKEKTNSSLQQQQKQHHRPTLTIYTEVDDINLKDGGWSFSPSLEGFRYTLTPVVPVTPFVARDSRKLTVDVFNEYYGGPKKTTYMEEKKEREEKEEENYIYVNNKDNSGGMKPSCTHEGNRENRVGLVQLMSYEEKPPHPPQPPVSSQSLQFSFVSVGGGGEGGSVDELKRSCSHTTEQASQKPAMSPSSLIEGEKGDFSVAAAFSATSVEKARKNTTKSEKRRFFFFLNPDSKIRSVTSKKKEEGKENQKNRQKNSRTADDEQGKELSNPSREQIICVGSKRLQKRLDDLKLVEHHVKNDGNCQFRALAQQLFGSEDLHELVRVHVVTYMKQFRERFDCYFASKQEADEYYRNMLKDGTWGDELTLRGASDGLHVNIHVLSSEQQNFYITYRPGEDAPSPPPAFLVDVATMRQKWRSASASGVNCGVQTATRKELEKGEVEAVEGTGAVGGGGMTPISAASEKERGDGRRINKKRGCYSEGDLTTPLSSKLWTPFKSKETVGPKPNVKNPGETVEKKEDFLLDVCALQRTLQWKLTHSTIRTASTPVVDISQEGGGGRNAANHESSLSFDVSDAAVMMQTGDSLNKSGIGSIGGCLDVSLELPNCVESPGATNSLHLAGLLTVSDEIAKFSAVGAENMRGRASSPLLY